MTWKPTQRKLAAILSADAVGYSRLMAQDEAETLKTLNAHRGLMGGLIRQHGGRIVNAVGDNLLAEFPSIVDAVACAIAIQEELPKRNTDLPAEAKMEFRIGVHLGDVMVEGDDIYGDGVNIAARLESLAEPGGICISGNVYDQIRRKMSHGYEDIGEQTLKNIADPIRVYRVRCGSDAGEEEAAKLTVPGFAGRPAIAVLAFDNLSGDSEQEYFADGIAEDLITRLQAFRLFPVIARNSSFIYKGKPVDVKQVSRELGVRYVIEGSVRKASNRVRVSAQLIDATTGHHVWADLYDRELTEIFALQDEITETVIGSLEPTLERFERRRAMHMAPGNLNAWDCAQRGSWHLFKFTKDGMVKARLWYERAAELDPHFSLAFAGSAMTYMLDLMYQWSGPPVEALAKALEEGQKSALADEEDPTAQFALGCACLYGGKHERAIAAFERAIELAPSLALAYHGLGSTLAMSDRPGEAIGFLKKAMRLSPHDPIMWDFCFILAVAYFVAERYEDAVCWAKRSLKLRSDNPRPYRLLAATYGHLGRRYEARAALAEMYRLTPDFSVELLRLVFPPAYLERYLAGWRKAGWKEDEQG